MPMYTITLMFEACAIIGKKYGASMGVEPKTTDLTVVFPLNNSLGGGSRRNKSVNRG